MLGQLNTKKEALNSTKKGIFPNIITPTFPPNLLLDKLFLVPHEDYSISKFMSYTCIFLHIALIFCTAPFLCEANWNLPHVTSSPISPREERKENEICGIGYINFVLSWSYKKLNNKERSLEKISLFNLFEEWKLKLLFNILICFRVIFTQLPFLRYFCQSMVWSWI